MLLAFYSFDGLVLAHTPSPAVCNDATCNVDLRDNVFQPASLSVKAPDPTTMQTVTIIWQNHGLTTHTINSGARGSSDGLFDHTLAPGDTFQLVIDQNMYNQILAKYPNGVLPYNCGLHFGMDATLTIRASTPSQPTLTVAATTNPATIQSGQTTTVSVQVTSEGTPISGSTVTMTSNNGGVLAMTSGTTEANGYFTTTLTTPTVTTQTTVTTTATATKTGYNDGTGQATVTVNPSSDSPYNPPGVNLPTNLWIYIVAVVAVVVALGVGVVIVRRMRRQ